jgi:hypothetical protein
LTAVQTPLTGLVFILTSYEPYCISKAKSRVAASPAASAFPLELSFGAIILRVSMSSLMVYALLEPERLTMSTLVEVGSQLSASMTTVSLKFSVYERQVGLGFIVGGTKDPVPVLIDTLYLVRLVGITSIRHK